MLITKIQLSAMERVRIPEEERADFYLYVDEFQNFATDSFAGILSEARKYRLNLILAHQYIGQLVTDVSTKVRDAVFGNCGTMLFFRIGATDAEFLEKEMTPEFLPEDMVNLPNYAIYLKLMVEGITSRPFSAATLPPFKVPTSAMTMESIVANSRRIYAKSRESVEDAISKWSGMMGDMAPDAAPTTGEQGSKLPEGQKISAVCASCGKQTSLNFVPTEGRPIYCKDCLAKIKTGEMPRVRVGKVNVPKTQDKYFSDLAGLGIEFEEQKKKEEPSTVFQSPKRGLSPLPPKGLQETGRGEPLGTLSLKDLKPGDSGRMPKEHKPSEISIEDLRESISQALKEQLSDVGTKSNENESEETEAR